MENISPETGGYIGGGIFAIIIVAALLNAIFTKEKPSDSWGVRPRR